MSLLIGILLLYGVIYVATRFWDITLVLLLVGIWIGLSLLGFLVTFAVNPHLAAWVGGGVFLLPLTIWYVRAESAKFKEKSL